MKIVRKYDNKKLNEVQDRLTRKMLVTYKHANWNIERR